MLQLRLDGTKVGEVIPPASRYNIIIVAENNKCSECLTVTTYITQYVSLFRKTFIAWLRFTVGLKNDVRFRLTCWSLGIGDGKYYTSPWETGYIGGADAFERGKKS